MPRKTVSPRKKFSPVTPLGRFWQELAISAANGKARVTADPDFPRDEVVQIAINRRGITERGKERYLQVLAERAKEPRPVPQNLSDPRGAAAKSAAVRREKAARKAAAGAVT